MEKCMNAVEIKNLSKSYKGYKLDNISFSLPMGSILGLVGANGAGKSTTIKLIMNAISRDSGEIRVLGKDNQDKCFDILKEEIGVVLDEAYFPEVITPDNVNAIMKNTYRNWDEPLYFNYLLQFKLPRKKAFKDFSRGMKMKLAIAVALSHHPKLLILDEATSGLDPIIRDEILDIFNDFTRDESHSVLISSHIVSDLEKICDYIAFIHDGRLLFCEEKDRLLEEYALVKLPRSAFETIPPKAIKGKRFTHYGAEALVLRSAVSSSFHAERVNLEEIILFLAKEERA